MKGLMLTLSQKVTGLEAIIETERQQHESALAAKDAVIAQKDESIAALEEQLENVGSSEDIQSIINKVEVVETKIKGIVPDPE